MNTSIEVKERNETTATTSVIPQISFDSVVLKQITQAAAGISKWSALFQTLYSRLTKLFEADNCLITLWDELRKTTFPAESFAPWGESYIISPRPGEVGLSKAILESEHAIFIENVFDSPHVNRERMWHYPTRSLLGLPLLAGDLKLGVVILGFNQTQQFSSDEITQAEIIAEQIAIAMHENESFMNQIRS